MGLQYCQIDRFQATNDLTPILGSGGKHTRRADYQCGASRIGRLLLADLLQRFFAYIGWKRRHEAYQHLCEKQKEISPCLISTIAYALGRLYESFHLHQQRCVPSFYQDLAFYHSDRVSTTNFQCMERLRRGHRSQSAHDQNGIAFKVLVKFLPWSRYATCHTLKHCPIFSKLNHSQRRYLEVGSIHILIHMRGVIQ